MLQMPERSFFSVSGAVVVVFKCSFVGNLPRLVELCKALDEGLHSEPGGALHNGFHLRNLVGANEVLYCVRAEHDLNSGDASLPVSCSSIIN